MTNTTCESPTAGCVLDVWQHEIQDDAICASAISSLLLDQPALVSQLGTLGDVEGKLRQATAAKRPRKRNRFQSVLDRLALARILENTDRVEEAQKNYDGAFQAITDFKLAATEISILAKLINQTLEKVGHSSGDHGCQRFHDQLMGIADYPNQMETQREAAFHHMENGQYAQAERIYHHLIAHGYEPASTRCHLARVLLATGRDSEAAAAVERAWRYRETAVPYVIVRIHFLRALLATLFQRDAARHLSALSLALDVPGSHNAWLMAPLLQILRPRLGEESFTFFANLANTVGGRVV